VRSSFKVEALNNIVIFNSSLDSAPEMELLKVVLVAKFEDAGLQGD